jgi:hypothetical protein
MVLSVKMKAQVKIVSVLLIIMLATAATAAVLPWAYDMIQKKQDMKSLDDVYNFFETMDSTIRNIAQNGGEESLRLKIPGKFEIYPDSDSSGLSNSIIFMMESKVSFIAEGDWIPLNTPNMNETATLGIDSPSVIFGKAERTGDNIIVQHRLWYRTLNDTSGNLYKIVLNTSGDNTKSTTTGSMKIQRLGSEVISGKPLTITKINIIV